MNTPTNAQNHQAHPTGTNNTPIWYTKNSRRFICTPSQFAREHFFYAQEIGQMQRLTGGHERHRIALDSYLFLAVYQGKGILHYEGEEYPLGMGDCFWIDCRKEHTYHSSTTDPWGIQWIHFNGKNAPAYYQLYREQHLPTFHSAHFSELLLTFHTLLQDREENPPALESIMSCRITNLLTDALTTAQKKETPDARNKMHDVRTFLDHHYTEELTLDGLASQFFMSKFYLARQFRATFDCTVIDYLVGLRITQAKQLLRYSDLSIAQIAEACGYRNQSYFSRQFLKVEGVGARIYRRSWK